MLRGLVQEQGLKITVICYSANENPAMDEQPDLNVYNPENLLAQAKAAQERLGYKILTFYVERDGLLAKTVTPHLAQFYYSPSGGTLRDHEMNIVLYSAKFDVYKGLGR
jgi:hypothetical protein